MDERCADWLRQVAPSESTWRTNLSDLRRVERHYGDLDGLYDQDGLQGVIASLTYTAEDEKSGAPNPSRLEIVGDLRKNLGAYRAIVQKYLRFRQEVEEEATRVIVTSGRGATPPVETEAVFSMERDLQAALRRSIAQLEPGLTIVDGGAERSVASGRIDILARDASGALVVIELKAVKAPRDAVAQILAYMGDLQQEEGGDVRGILVAPEYDLRAVSAARMVPALKLVTYGFSFSFRPLG